MAVWKAMLIRLSNTDPHKCLNNYKTDYQDHLLFLEDKA